MNYRIRLGLSQNQRSGQNLGALAASSKKWHKTLVDIYTGENKGKYKQKFDTDIAYRSELSRILENLNAWMEDLKIIIDAMVDDAAESQMDKLRFEEWVSRDLMQKIDSKIS